MTKINGDNSWDKCLNKTDSQPKTNQTQNSEKPSVFTKEGKSFVRKIDEGLFERYFTNDDGTVNYRVLTEYDEKSVKYSHDYNADGKIDATKTYVNNDKGEHVKTIIDRDADGKPEFIATFEHDEEGKIVKQSQDKNADGTVDLVFHTIYDADGNLTHTGIDKNGDGIIDSFEER